jgi:uncharacterized membrane protein YphA (DoxX/SURF4 family)
MKRKITFALSLLFGLMFLNSGLNKILEYIPVPENLPEQMLQSMQAMESLGWLIPLLAAVEITGGILAAIPRTRALGAAMLLPVMAGIVASHIHWGDRVGFALVLAAVHAYLLSQHLGSYRAMWAK